MVLGTNLVGNGKKIKQIIVITMDIEHPGKKLSETRYAHFNSKLGKWQDRQGDVYDFPAPAKPVQVQRERQPVKKMKPGETKKERKAHIKNPIDAKKGGKGKGNKKSR